MIARFRRRWRFVPYLKEGFLGPLRFSIGQSTKDLALMEELKNYFNNLGKSLNLPSVGYAVYLSISKDINMVSLAINQSDFIIKVLIPFFDNLTWHSKKELDYRDWKAILKIRNLGLHYTEKGAKVINLILSQMNNNRLSSKSTTPVIDRSLLQAEIDIEGRIKFRRKGRWKNFLKVFK